MANRIAAQTATRGTQTAEGATDSGVLAATGHKDKPPAPVFAVRRGPLAYVVGRSLRVPGLYAPVVYDGALHVDGGVLDDLPVAALARASEAKTPRTPRVPNVVNPLMGTMTIGSAMATSTVLAQADLAIHPDTTSIGFLEWHQIDRAREAGRIATREALPHIMEVVQSGGACG
jgi:NTE family protein